MSGSALRLTSIPPRRHSPPRRTMPRPLERPGHISIIYIRGRVVVRDQLRDSETERPRTLTEVSAQPVRGSHCL